MPKRRETHFWEGKINANGEEEEKKRKGRLIMEKKTN